MVLVIPHIPKTGGQTLRSHFHEHLVHDEDFIHAGPWGDNVSSDAGMTPWIDRPGAVVRAPRVVMGHGVTQHSIQTKLIGHEIVYATCLRDPADRWVSGYNFLRGTGGISEEVSFLQYVKDSKNDDYMINFLRKVFMGGGDASMSNKLIKVEDALREFDCLGILERFDNYSNWIVNVLKLPQVTTSMNVTG